MSNSQLTAEWLPRREAVRLLGTHKKTLLRWAAAGRLAEARDERGRVFYSRLDVDRLVAARAAVGGAGDAGVRREVDANRNAARAAPAASSSTASKGRLVLRSKNLRRIREALGGYEPNADVLVAALRSWGADAAAWRQLCTELDELDVEATVDGIRDTIAFGKEGRALLEEVQRGTALILRGEQLERYRTRVLETMMAGDLVAVRVEQLRALRLLGQEEDDDHAHIVWRRLEQLREAQRRVERLDALLRMSGFSEGVEALEGALLKQRNLGATANAEGSI